MAPIGEITTEIFIDDGSQWWIDVLAAALSGLVHLPLALVLVWGFHRLRIDHWLVVSAAAGTVFSVVVTAVFEIFVWRIDLFFEQMLVEMGVNGFIYMLTPNLFVCFVGAIGFGWWLKHRQRGDEKELFK